MITSEPKILIGGLLLRLQRDLRALHTNDSFLATRSIKAKEAELLSIIIEKFDRILLIEGHVRVLERKTVLVFYPQHVFFPSPCSPQIYTLSREGTTHLV